METTKTDMKWSEVPVGEVFSRRECPEARWLRTSAGTMLLLDFRGMQYDRIGSVVPNSPENSFKYDDCFLTGERLVVQQEFEAKVDEPHRIVLRIKKAEPDLKVPTSFSYDPRVFFDLYHNEIADSYTTFSVAKAMFDAGIALATNAMNVEAAIQVARDEGYVAGKNAALRETEDMFEKGQEFERKRLLADGVDLRPSSDQLEAAKQFQREEEKRRDVIRTIVELLLETKDLKPKQFLRYLRKHLKIIYS